MKILFAILALLLKIEKIQAQNFRSTYTGQFQIVQGSTCSSPTPVLRAACQGDVRVTSTSDATISCGTPRVGFDGLSYIDCTNTCEDFFCFLVYDLFPGEIEFVCEGDTVEDTEAIFTFQDSGDGNCTVSADDELNFHIARLGISCSDGSTSSFVYDDFHMECDHEEGVSSLNLGSNLYTCVDGSSCPAGQDCVSEFNPLSIVSRASMYADQCVESLQGLPIQPAEPTPLNLLLTSTVFQAGWGRLYNTTTVGDSCPTISPVIEIECVDGTLRYVGADSSTVNCVGVDENTMRCTDSGTSYEGQFTYVQYSCTGQANAKTYPDSVVTYPEEVALCANNNDPILVQHALHLGIQCTTASDGAFFFHDDFFTECGEFGVIFEYSSSRFTCLQEAAFGTLSTIVDAQTIAEVSMTTDAVWQYEAAPYSVCYSTSEGPGQILPLSIETTSPTRHSTGSPVAVTPTIAPSPSPTAFVDANFRAKYVGQFQMIEDPLCESPLPVLRAFCVGDIRVTDTSDPSIQCDVTPRVDSEDGYNFIECRNTCVGTACDNLFKVVSTSDNVRDRPFAKIYFECTGDTVADTEGRFSFQDTGDGSCEVETEFGGRNFHVAQMGVECPVLTGSGREYTFDDLFFECNLLSVAVQTADGFGQVYTCIDGERCTGIGLPCNVDFDDVVVFASLPMFFNTCVQSLKGLPVSLPTDPPRSSTGELHTLFRIQWAILFDDAAELDCSGNTPTIEIECVDGEISFAGADDSSVVCTPRGTAVLECGGGGNSFVDRFTAVRYFCTGSQGPPETTITYPEAEAFCSGNPREATVRHALNLAVQCDFEFDGPGPEWYSIDYWTECDNRSTEFDFLDEFGEPGVDFTCAEGAIFPRLSVQSNTQMIPEFSISTEEGWSFNADNRCFARGPAPITPPTTAPVFQPTAAPTPAAVDTPTADPNTAPTREPDMIDPDPADTGTPTQAPVLSVSRESSEDVPVGAIAGAAVAGVAIICCAAVAVFYLRKKPAAKEKPPEPPYGYGENVQPQPRRDPTDSNTDDYSENTGYASHPHTAPRIPYGSRSPPASPYGSRSPPSSPRGYRSDDYEQRNPPLPPSSRGYRSGEYEDRYPPLPPLNTGRHPYHEEQPREVDNYRYDSNEYDRDSFPPFASDRHQMSHHYNEPPAQDNPPSSNNSRGSHRSSAPSEPSVGIPVPPNNRLRMMEQCMSVVQVQGEPVVRARLADPSKVIGSRRKSGDSRGTNRSSRNEPSGSR